METLLSPDKMGPHLQALYNLMLKNLVKWTGYKVSHYILQFFKLLSEEFNLLSCKYNIYCRNKIKLFNMNDSQRMYQTFSSS